MFKLMFVNKLISLSRVIAIFKPKQMHFYKIECDNSQQST